MDQRGERGLTKCGVQRRVLIQGSKGEKEGDQVVISSIAITCSVGMTRRGIPLVTPEGKDRW